MIKVQLPTREHRLHELNLNYGDVVFFIGQNGSGKSSLLNNLFQKIGSQSSVYVLAHRKNTFSSDIIDFSNSEYKNAQGWIFNEIKGSQCRYRVNYDSQMVAIPIVKLKNKVIARALSFVDSFKSNNNQPAELIKSEVDVLNMVFADAKLSIEFFLDDEANVMARNIKGENPDVYPISMLSDGEKSALIIASEIICADENTTIFLDEPERHMHRSIVSPLLSSLMKYRRDCVFFVATHELSLPAFFDNVKVVNVKNCYFSEQREPIYWDFNVVEDYDELFNGVDEQTKIDILGARDKVLFVEGVTSSLDRDLYSAIFPMVSVVSKQKCDLVELAEKGLRLNDEIHRVSAYGIIDNDNKVQAKVDNLKKDFIFSLDVHSIESIYYHPRMIKFVIDFVKEANGIDNVDALFMEIHDFAIDAINEKRDHLCCRAVEKTIRADLMSAIPKQQDIKNRIKFNKEIDIECYVNKEIAAFDAMIAERNLDALVSRYPIRETNLLAHVAKKCGFADRSRYELNVIRTIKSNADARAFVLSLLGGLDEAILGCSDTENSPADTHTVFAM